jgi:hypothetical protein
MWQVFLGCSMSDTIALCTSRTNVNQPLSEGYCQLDECSQSRDALHKQLNPLVVLRFTRDNPVD